MIRTLNFKPNVEFYFDSSVSNIVRYIGVDFDVRYLQWYLPRRVLKGDSLTNNCPKVAKRGL